MNAKQRAVEIYNQHLSIAATDGKLFRKTVMDQLRTETGCSLAAAATHYNNAKKAAPLVEGLGRAAAPKGLRKPGAGKQKTEELQPDEECYTVLELVQHGSDYSVHRCYSHLMQGDASEDFDDRVVKYPYTSWIMIKGLGPNSGDTFRLGIGEEVIKRHDDPSKKAEEVEAA